MEQNEMKNNGINGENAVNEKVPEFLPLCPLEELRSDLPAFPVHCMPEIMREYILEVAAHSQTSVDMAAVIGLGVLAVCLQGKFVVQGTPGYFEPLSLYTVVIAQPGERKSSVLRDMTKYLYEYEQEYNRNLEADIRENRNQRDRLEREIEALKSKLPKISPEETAQLACLQDELSDLPEIRKRRFFADDCSSEALVTLMARNEGIISVISSEGGIFDIMAGRYSSKANIDVWLKGHCGDAIQVDRQGRESECISHPALSAILTIQPSVLDEIMSNTTMFGRGLIARFLYSSPPSMIGHRQFCSPAISLRTTDDYRGMIKQLMDIPKREEPYTICLSAEATDIIAEYFQEHEKYLEGEGQMISDWASKYIGMILRIAGLLCVADGQSQMLISAEEMRRAVEIGKYYLAHACYAYSLMGSDTNVAKAKYVIARIRKERISKIKRWELAKLCRGRYFKTGEEILPTLELLEKNGYICRIIPDKETRPGRKSDVIIAVNPEIYTQEPPV